MQPLSRSARVAAWLSGCFDFASRVAHPLWYFMIFYDEIFYTNSVQNSGWRDTVASWSFSTPLGQNSQKLKSILVWKKWKGQVSTFVILSTCKQLPHQQCANTLLVSLETFETPWNTRRETICFPVWNLILSCSLLFNIETAPDVIDCNLQVWMRRAAEQLEATGTAGRRVCNQKSWPLLYSDGWWILTFWLNIW